MDLVLRHARLVEGDGTPVDIGIAGGRIASIAPSISAAAPSLDLAGKLVAPGLIETHIHLDKSAILGRCRAEKGDLEEAIGEVAKAKRAFTPEDVYARAKQTLERCILNGTTHMRTQLEVDPGIGLRGFEGVWPLIEEYRWAIEIEICVFPQEGLLNNPGTDELMVEALKRGARVVGAAPYTDTNPQGQMDRVFAMARDFDCDVDMHLDFGPDPGNLDLDYVCRLADRHGWGGRVTIGHVTKLSAIEPEGLAQAARRMADAGVALIVLPATDLYLMGRHMTHNHLRGVTPAHKLLTHGVNCALSTNNVLNPFTPFGDCSLIRMANLYANICHVGADAEMAECFRMITTRSAKLMRLPDYGLEPGKSADLTVFDAGTSQQAVAELAQPLMVFKRGRQTVARQPAELLRPA